MTDLPTGYTYREHLTADQLTAIHALLATTEWAADRDLATTVTAFRHSHPVVVLTPDGQVVGCARLISDTVSVGYLTDVIVHPDHRGRGIGTWIGEWSIAWAQRHGIKRVVLATTDAHLVYYASGFDTLRDAGVWMEWNTRPRYVPEGFEAPPNPYRVDS